MELKGINVALLPLVLSTKWTNRTVHIFQAIHKSIRAGWHKLSHLCMLALLLDHKPASELSNEPLLKTVKANQQEPFHIYSVSAQVAA